MRIKIFLVLISTALALTARNCFKYNCVEDANNTDTCMSAKDNTFNFITCKERYKCILLDNSTELAKCRNSSNLTNLAGEYCDNNEYYCGHGLECVSNICRGKNVSDPCQSDSECDTELYCFKGNCTSPTKKCDEDGSKCRSNEFCAKGICVIIAQLPNGNLSDSPAACKSYYVMGGKCADGPKLKESKNKSEICEYEIGGKKYIDTGICEKSEKGGKFCPLGKGNINIDNVIFFYHIVFKIYGF